MTGPSVPCTHAASGPRAFLMNTKRLEMGLVSIDCGRNPGASTNTSIIKPGETHTGVSLQRTEGHRVGSWVISTPRSCHLLPGLELEC